MTRPTGTTILWLLLQCFKRFYMKTVTLNPNKRAMLQHSSSWKTCLSACPLDDIRLSAGIKPGLE